MVSLFSIISAVRRRLRGPPTSGTQGATDQAVLPLFSDIRLLQTSDPVRYNTLLAITSRASREFCRRQRISFEPYVGIKRGSHPWHAIFNRIPMLADVGRSGFKGWVIYLDADAFPADMNFDLRGYLAQNDQFAVIGARGGDAPWNINSGILLFNFRHSAAREIVSAWEDTFLREMPNDRLRAMPEWIEPCPNDQGMLHSVLAARNDHAAVVKMETFDLIGWTSSRLFAHAMRIEGSFERRCEQAMRGVDMVIGRSN